MRTVCVFVLILLLFSCSGERGARTAAASLPDLSAMWDFDDPEATEARFRAVIPVAIESGDSGYYAELLTQIARAEGLQRRFADAHAMLDSARAMIRDEKTVAMARYLLERGRVFNSSGKPGTAREYFLDAYELSMEIGEDFYAVDALHMLAIVDPPERQMQWNLKALELAETSSDERARKWRGSLYNNMGWTYHDRGDYPKALQMFRKSLEFREEAGDSAGILIARWTIARTHRSMGDVEEALEMQLELEALVEEYGLEQDGYVYEEIAECLLLLGRRDESREYFGLTYELLSRDPYLAANEPERLKRLQDLSR